MSCLVFLKTTSPLGPKRGRLNSAGKRQESATFLQHNFFNVARQFLFVAALLVKLTCALQKTNVAAQLLQRNFAKIDSATSALLVACCRGGV